MSSKEEWNTVLFLHSSHDKQTQTKYQPISNSKGEKILSIFRTLFEFEFESFIKVLLILQCKC